MESKSHSRHSPLILFQYFSKAFAPLASPRISTPLRMGYLDDLSGELYGEVDNPDTNVSREETQAKETENFGVQDWSGFVDFEEFDGGDGQMGVAGDGKKGLEKFGDNVSPALAKSKTMSAKNAWGTSTGYSDTLREQGMDTARAQQLENWANQQELRQKRLDHSRNLDSFDSQKADENWRELSSFGIERNQVCCTKCIHRSLCLLNNKLICHSCVNRNLTWTKSLEQSLPVLSWTERLNSTRVSDKLPYMKCLSKTSTWALLISVPPLPQRLLRNGQSSLLQDLFRKNQSTFSSSLGLRIPASWRDTL